MAFGVAHRRAFPWRDTKDPWAILVSEVMLQQTQTSRVLGPYRRFLAAFPTPGACAGASVGEVLRAWAGHGYNRRALRLHQAASVICERHGGRVPADHASLRALPGVGSYTARAVRCFGFGEQVAVVDTNAARVLTRAVAGGPLKGAALQTLADAVLADGRAWEHNQAVFDLGATVCLRRRPRCEACSLAGACRWAAEGWPEPDPASVGAAAVRRQEAFEGSLRQRRGRLIDALRAGPLRVDAAAVACGLSVADPIFDKMVTDLLAEGLLRRRRGRLELP